MNDQCIITKYTRGECSSCRLKKCLTLGMNRNLIRSSPQRRHRQRQTTDQDTTLPLQVFYSHLIVFLYRLFFLDKYCQSNT